MRSPQRKLLALVLAAAFAAPVLGVAQDANATRADAVSNRTTARESGRQPETPRPQQAPAQPEVVAAAPAQKAVLTRTAWLQLDVNSDGKLGASEVAANAELSAAFAAMDSNGDGLVTQAEYTAYSRARR